MPTLTNIDDGAARTTLAPAPAPEHLPPAPTPTGQPTPMPDSAPTATATATATATVLSPPAPPPAAPELQLKMWHVVLRRRQTQVSRLPQGRRRSFAVDLARDAVSAGAVTGRYASFLLQDGAPASSVDQIGLHLLALFYRALDDRLPTAARKHGIDAVRRACGMLDELAAEESAKVDGRGDEGGQKRRGQGATKRAAVQEGESNDHKKLRKESSVNSNVATRRVEGTSGAGQTSPLPSEGSDKREGTQRTSGSSPHNNDGAGTEAEAQLEAGSGQALPHQAGAVSRAALRRPPPPKPTEERTGARQGRGPDRPRTAPGNSGLGTLDASGQAAKWQGGSLKAARNATAGAAPPPARSPCSRPEQCHDGIGATVTATNAGEASTLSRGGRSLSPANKQGQPTGADRLAKKITTTVLRPSAMTSKTNAEIGIKNGSATAMAANVETGNKRTVPALQTSATSHEDPPSSGNDKGKPENDKGKPEEANTTAEKFTAIAPLSSAVATVQSSTTPCANNSDTDDSDVIDLTEDSPPPSPSPTPSPPVATTMTAAPTCAIQQGDDGGAGRPPAVPHHPPSPPASPLPPAIVRLPASPAAAPTPFAKRCSLLLHADGNPKGGRGPTSSGSLKGRPSCVVNFDAGYHLDGSGSCLDDARRIDVSERLKTWDPYWKIIEELGTRQVPAQHPSGPGITLHGPGNTTVATRTTPCVLARQSGPTVSEHPTSCASVHIDLPTAASVSELSRKAKPIFDRDGCAIGMWGVRWGTLPLDNHGKKRAYKTGDRRLIVRTVPLQRTEKERKKRADGHLWPKGTFLQLVLGKNSGKALSILQRKQQAHDLSEWKGMSHPLDLTGEIVDTNAPIEIRIASKEIAEPSEKSFTGVLLGSYGVHVAICEYIAPDDLYEELLGNTAADSREVTIPRTTLHSARKMAKEYMAGQMVLIDDSDEESSHKDKSLDTGGENAKSLQFSLLCPISKTVMQTPVRGRHCKHMQVFISAISHILPFNSIQCMDLRNYLHANKNVTGGRWRCGVCESFVSVRELVHCGLFQAMLDTLRDKISSSRDRVLLHSDGNWKIMDENRLRYSKRGPGMNTESKNSHVSGKRVSSELETIDLL